MTRSWPTLALIAAMTLLVGEGRRAAASTQAALTIIMTTLGTDGNIHSSVSNVVISNNDPSGPMVPNPPLPMPLPGIPQTSLPASPASSGGGGGGTDSAPTNPTGGTSNSNGDSPTGNGPIDPSVDLPIDDSGNGSGEPTIPSPPVVLPPGPSDPGSVDLPTDNPPETDDSTTNPPPPNTTGSPAETPEPATLTMAIAGALGVAGWARRKRKAA